MSVLVGQTASPELFDTKVFRGSTMKHFTLNALAVLVLALSHAPGYSQPSERKDSPSWFRVYYDTQMLIASNKDEVAVIVLVKKTEKKVEYVFRLLKKDGTEVRGKGEVISKVAEKIKTDDPNKYTLKYDRTLATIKAGSINLSWTPLTIDQGNIWYYPEYTIVQISKPEYFDDIELKRFRKGKSPAEPK
jgi:hypothetical protein